MEGNKNSPLGQVLPAGDLPVPTVDVDSPEYSYVSAAISDTTVAGNAFGLFVSGANGLDVRASSFDDNLVVGRGPAPLRRQRGRRAHRRRAATARTASCWPGRRPASCCRRSIAEPQRTQRGDHLRAAAGQRAERDRDQPGELRQQLGVQQPGRRQRPLRRRGDRRQQHQRPGQRHRVQRDGHRRPRRAPTDVDVVGNDVERLRDPGHRPPRRRAAARRSRATS